jgi:hypothetical protein
VEIVQPEIMAIGMAAAAILYLVPYVISYGISKLFKIFEGR